MCVCGWGGGGGGESLIKHLSWMHSFFYQYLDYTVFILSIGTPYLLTILVLKFEIVHSTTSSCV